MTSRGSPTTPVRLVLTGLKTDARKLVTSLQDAAVRLRASRRPPSASRKRKSESPSRPGENPPVNEALDAYQAGETLRMDEHHTRFRQEIQSVGRPLDEFLEDLISRCMREGVSAAQRVSRTDATRDWIRRLYALEQLEEAMHAFYRAEVAYRTARIGLELSRPPNQVAAREAEGNRLNRQGTNALFHLSDHLIDTAEALLPLAGALEELEASPAEGAVLERQAFAEALASILDGRHVYDDARYLIERGLETIPLVPYEAGIEETLILMRESVERLSAQRQSRERGWLPEEPARDIHATVAGFWLLTAQLTTTLVYVVARECGAATEVEPVQAAERLRAQLLELMTRAVLYGIEVRRRLDYRDG